MKHSSRVVPEGKVSSNQLDTTSQMSPSQALEEGAIFIVLVPVPRTQNMGSLYLERGLQALTQESSFRRQSTFTDVSRGFYNTLDDKCCCSSLERDWGQNTAHGRQIPPLKVIPYRVADCLH